MGKPYYDFDGIQIINGHAPDKLKDMESESVQMCVTSPPYWGLRDYGTEPQIWDGEEGCRHEWGDLIPRQHKSGGNNMADEEWKRPSRGAQEHNDCGNYCQLCGAWKGSLGLEPTPELYTKHIADIFREVRRVLKKDGTCWLNLGDSYAGSGQGWMKGGQSIGGPKQSTNKGSIGNFINYKPPGYISSRDPNSGLKPKDLIGIPWRVAFALQADGWWLRSDIIWNKPNPMPESVKDRPTKSHEYLFLLTKSAKYFYDADAVKEPSYTEPLNRWGGKSLKEETVKHSKYLEMQKVSESSALRAGRDMRPDPTGRNKRSVWTIPTQPFPEAHFAVFPEKLIEPCILAGSRIGDIVLDPFGGSGTTARVAKRLNRKAILIELNPDYCDMRTSILDQGNLPFTQSGTKQVQGIGNLLE